ncbi:MAG: hypothetical protein O7E54_01770 [Planctomycetota bacterium]|nr:hypothetical protein [Planctomycetota bacterium]
MRTLLATISFLCCAVAGEPTIPFDDLELLPIPEHRWELLELQHRDLFEGLKDIHDRREELREQKTMWRRAQHMALDQKEAPMQERLRALLGKEGVGPDVLERLRRVPAGTRRAARCAHAVVVAHAPEARRRRVARLVHAVDAAQIALVRQRERLERILEGHERQERVVESLEETIEDIERRFWRAIDYLLAADKKRAVRMELPARFQSWEDPLGQMVFLADLSLAQLGRLWALQKESDSESSADEAAAQKIERSLDDDALPDDERRALDEKLHAAWTRLTRLHHGIHVRAFEEVLTARQREEFLAVPPRVSVDDRHQGPDEVLEGLDLDAARLKKLAGISERFERIEREHEEAEERLVAKRGEMGRDSPEKESMEMSLANLEGATSARVRVLLSEVFGEILTPDQIVAWVLADPDDD